MQLCRDDNLHNWLETNNTVEKRNYQESIDIFKQVRKKLYEFCYQIMSYTQSNKLVDVLIALKKCLDILK